MTLRSEIPKLVDLPARVVHWRPDEAREPRVIPLKLTHADALRIRAVRTEGESVTATLKSVPNDEAPGVADGAHADAYVAASPTAADAGHGEASSAEAAPRSPRHYELTLTPHPQPNHARMHRIKIPIRKSQIRDPFPPTISLLKRGIIDLEPLVTHTAPLDEYPRLLATAATRDDGYIKGVVTLNGNGH